VHARGVAAVEDAGWLLEVVAGSDPSKADEQSNGASWESRATTYARRATGDLASQRVSVTAMIPMLAVLTLVIFVLPVPLLDWLDRPKKGPGS
jgi:hypothetical protein